MASAETANAAGLLEYGSRSLLGQLAHHALFLFYGVLTTFGLFLLMHLMIYRAAPALKEENPRKIADIIMEHEEIQTFREEQLPDKPDEVEEQPPEPELPDIQPEDISQNFDLSIGRARININIGKGFSADGEYLPIVKVAPIYPRIAQTRGLEGYCIVEYTVTTSGAVRDPVVVDCPNRVFARASLKASLKFKYKPRIVDGEPVEVTGVLNKFTYELEK